MKNNPTGRRWCSAAAMLAACAVAVVGLAGTASAASLDPYNIDPTRKSSITLTKYGTPAAEVPAVPAQGSGIENGVAPTTNSVLLDGAVFEIYKVNHSNLNLTKNEGWQYLETLIAATTAHPAKTAVEAQPGVTLNRIGSPVTTGRDGTGVITWTGLDLGLYYVVETNVPAGYKASEPFFVTAPMTDPVELDNWMYDVFVYPKNIKDDSVKVPLDTETPKPGDKMAWELRTTIPGDITHPVTIMRFTDTLAPELAPDVAAPGAVTMQIGTTWQSPVTSNISLVPETDFSVTVDGPSNTVSATLTAAGLAKINGTPNHYGKTILVHFNTVLEDDYVGVITNDAKIIVNKPGSSTETEEVTTPPGQAKFGEVTVNKTDSQNVPLTGAIFKVYYSHSATPDFTETGNPVTGVADTGAVCDMAGSGDPTSCTMDLRYSDFAEDTQLTAGDPRWNHYWLVEVTAPRDFELLTEAIPFEITKDTVVSGTHANTDMTVKNVKRGGGLELPFTGGTGTVLFLLGGVALLGGATVMIIHRVRRRNVAAE
ncbi:SpaH/EbpB family LPXTG-anchored major pilin [Klugiella xanthotipulae]|uniref:LPXTG-motif cell wall-anchored protein/fimbrial isopeptide formation D2 family protein n=2 Tax=Klugiella xanthotipulae TaxID=244735 RepID=A0A543I481_9MICO|nr:SpaH/EbpB family LPXTG-anchored major pilin [Klugiella xanthotipulae]TQM65402.1 LPXTG-motif cell wall-anchored protein/fimbrial isopeptide formation D2 family protein [Klugiella xanthotipulae]